MHLIRRRNGFCLLKDRGHLCHDEENVTSEARFVVALPFICSVLHRRLLAIALSSGAAAVDIEIGLRSDKAPLTSLCRSTPV